MKSRIPPAILLRPEADSTSHGREEKNDKVLMDAQIFR
jgi:hypothetical protein